MHGQFGFKTPEGRDQVNGHIMLDISAPCCWRSKATGSCLEQVSKDIFIALVAAKILTGPRSKPLLLVGTPLFILPCLVRIKAGLQTLFPEFVIEFSLVFLAETLIGLGDILETGLRLLVAGVQIRVPFSGQLAIGLFDDVLGSVLGNPQYFIKVLCHGITCPNAR